MQTGYIIQKIFSSGNK